MDHTFAAPIPKHFNIMDVKSAKGYFYWYKKQCKEDPEYGKARRDKEISQKVGSR